MLVDSPGQLPINGFSSDKEADCVTGIDGAVTGSTVQVDTVSKFYGSMPAVDAISLDIGAGEFVSLLGPSGSGKTTLLMMIAGFERPDAGRILIGQRDFTHVAPNKRGVGMVFQKYALFPHMTIADNIAFPLKMRKISREVIAARVDAALSLVRLEGYGERQPGQLSGGQQQRIAVARALVFEPPVLLMDEPLGALDKKLREQMQIEIKAIQERLGVTVVYVTHDQEEALTMSDRVAVMNKGRLEQIGTPIDLYQAPQSPFVADFIGKMNFIDGEYLGRDGSGLRVRLSADATLRVPHAPNGSAADLADNSPVRIAVRPERLQLAPPGEGGPEAMAGRIDAAIFVGSFRIYLVAIDGRDAEPLHIQVPAAGAPSYARGDAVDVVMEHDAVRLFQMTAA